MSATVEEAPSPRLCPVSFSCQRTDRREPAIFEPPLDLFQRHTDELGASRLARNEYNRAALEALTAQIGELQLRLVHPDDREIPVASFELQDCADTLSENPRELQVEMRDRSIYDMYFSQPLA